jgi:hypothetical protein
MDIRAGHLIRVAVHHGVEHGVIIILIDDHHLGLVVGLYPFTILRQIIEDLDEYLSVLFSHFLALPIFHISNRSVS